MVESQRQDGVQALALAVLKRLDRDAGGGAHVHDLHDVLDQLLLGVGPGEHQPREVEQVLLLALELRQQVVGLVAGVLDLGGQDGVVVALLHGLLLLLDDLLVDPGAAHLHGVDRLSLVPGLQVPADADGQLRVDEVRDAVVVERRVEVPHDHHLAPLIAHLEARGGAVGREVDRHGGDIVLRVLEEPVEHLFVLERELAPRVEQAVHGLQAPLAVERREVAVDLLEAGREVVVDAGEALVGGVRVVGGHRDGQVALARDVGHALLELLGKHLVHRLGVLAQRLGGLRVRVVELAALDLVVAQGLVHDAELHRDVVGEVVVDAGGGRQDHALVCLAGVLVGDVVECQRLGEVAVLDLADAVLEHQVVADRVDGVVRAPAGGLLLCALLLQGARALLEAARDVRGVVGLALVHLRALAPRVADLALGALQLAVELLARHLHIALLLALRHVRELRVYLEADVVAGQDAAERGGVHGGRHATWRGRCRGVRRSSRSRFRAPGVALRSRRSASLSERHRRVPSASCARTRPRRGTGATCNR